MGEALTPSRAPGTRRPRIDHERGGRVQKVPDLARRRARNKVPGWDYFRQFSNWHYLNAPRGTDEIAADESRDNCVLAGIDFHWDQLANEDLEDWQRAQSLFFIGY